MSLLIGKDDHDLAIEPLFKLWLVVVLHRDQMEDNGIVRSADCDPFPMKLTSVVVPRSVASDCADGEVCCR